MLEPWQEVTRALMTKPLSRDALLKKIKFKTKAMGDLRREMRNLRKKIVYRDQVISKLRVENKQGKLDVEAARKILADHGNSPFTFKGSDEVIEEKDHHGEGFVKETYESIIRQQRQFDKLNRFVEAL